MTFKELQELIGLINKSNLAEFKMEDGDLKIHIRTAKFMSSKQVAAPQFIQQPAGAPHYAAAPVALPAATPPPAPKAEVADLPPAAAAAPVASNLLEIKSPIVGTFYRSPSPDKAAYVKVGDTVDKGSPVCVVEAMKLFNEIESEIKGKIVKIMVEDASPVEYDQVLFLVDPKG
jgi:acetyl-CoA carboxylase biotin carboxyl carrier protein